MDSAGNIQAVYAERDYIAYITPLFNVWNVEAFQESEQTMLHRICIVYKLFCSPCVDEEVGIEPNV